MKNIEKMTLNGQEIEVRRVENLNTPKTYKKTLNKGAFTYDMSMVEEYEKLMQEQADFDKLEAENIDKKIVFDKTCKNSANKEDFIFWQKVNELKALDEAKKEYKQSKNVLYAYNVYKKIAKKNNILTVFDYDGFKIKHVKDGFLVIYNDENYFIDKKESMFLLDGVDFSPKHLAKIEIEQNIEVLAKMVAQFNKFEDVSNDKIEINGTSYSRKEYNTAKEYSIEKIANFKNGVCQQMTK